MIPARKSPLVSRWFSGHCERRFRRAFQRVRVHGLERLREGLREGPVLLLTNHASWWDALLAVWFGHRVLRCDGYAMMDADNLRRFAFFARVGGFGIERGRGGDHDALEYTASLLAGPNRLVWIFPQGDEMPVTRRPLGFRKGAAVVAHAVPAARVIPMAIRYTPGPAERFELWLSVGAAVPRAADLDETRAAQERAVEAELDRIDHHLCEGAPLPTEVLLERRRGPVQRLAERMLTRALPATDRR